jgi:hypothetical protein
MNKLPKPMGTEELFALHTSTEIPKGQPGGNKWLKYGIPAGIIIISLVISYQITKNQKNDGKDNK